LSPYKPIRNYGLIGNLSTSALVSMDGSIDWCCMPRFDSPSVFAALLDSKKGGTFSIRPTEKYVSEQFYEKDSAILLTRMKNRHGILEIFDFMPYPGDHSQKDNNNRTKAIDSEICRRVRSVGGSLEISIDYSPRLSYAKNDTNLSHEKGANNIISATNDSKNERLFLTTDVPLRIREKTATARIRISETKELWFVVSFNHKNDGNVKRGNEAKLEKTRHFWHEWRSEIKYRGLYKKEVIRSAITLKLLTYSPTGAMIASPTTSLPEVVGGVRNWDYRYSWLRDSAFSLWAFHALGLKTESMNYIEWMRSMIEGLEPKTLYGIEGKTEPEKLMDHFEGYKGSKPVRIGNSASNQFQLDVYGITLDALYFANKHGTGISKEDYDKIARPLAALVEKNWKRKDRGIWEVRGESRHFLYSKVWCYAAMDRASRIARNLKLSADVERWSKVGRKMKLDILKRGWDTERRTFLQAYDTDDLDASNLLIPHVKFLDWKDERVVSTVEYTMKKLMTNGFVYRYLVPDGLPGKEGAFMICTLWLVDCLVKMGKIKEGKGVFENVLHSGNHLSLFSEQIDPHNNQLLGNFPQSFTHMGIIISALTINSAFSSEKKSAKVT
jgi:GH15 family glucan-1,4-alpha-glucosidase